MFALLFASLFLMLTALTPINHAILDDILDLESFEQREESEFVMPCILQLAEKYFRSERVMRGALAIVGLTADPSPIEIAVVRTMFEDERHKLTVMVKDGYKFHYSPAHVTEKASNYFFLVTKYEDLLPNIKQFLHLPTFNPLANVVVLFTNAASEVYIERESMKIFQELFRYSMYNVNVLSQRNRTVQSFTYFPYESDNCATSVKNVKKIDECVNEKIDVEDDDLIKMESFHVDLFPKIPRRFHNCKWNVSVYPNAPYTVEENGVVTKGLEILMLKQIAQRLSLKLSYATLDAEVVNSFVTPNATHGVYSNILQG